MDQKIWKSPKGKLYDLQFFQDQGIGRAIGPLPEGIGYASVGSPGVFIEVSGESRSETMSLLRQKVEEKENSTGS